MNDEKTTKAEAIDALVAEDALAAMQSSHAAAINAVKLAYADIALAAHEVARTIESKGTLHYAAAGSSGLMALADACELPGTFGIPHSQISIHMAGGVPADGVMPNDTEDSTSDAMQNAATVAARDLAIVVSASGTTPYAVAFAKAALDKGTKVIGIANAPGSELLQISDVSIALPSAPEVIGGSTRLGAGTAQKVALNMVSTQAGILLGHVHDGLMVNLQADNAKLRKRAISIVAEIANVADSDAADALEATQHNTKAACLVARGLQAQDAFSLLNRHNGHLRACLTEIGAPTRQ